MYPWTTRATPTPGPEYRRVESREDKQRYLARKAERTVRLYFLFKHRHQYGQEILLLWPEQPDRHRKISHQGLFGNILTESTPVENEDEATRIRFHRVLSMSMLEGDFELFEVSPSQAAARMAEYGLPAKAPRWMRDRPWV